MTWEVPPSFMTVMEVVSGHSTEQHNKL
jgi:hypothetical protein